MSVQFPSYLVWGFISDKAEKVLPCLYTEQSNKGAAEMAQLVNSPSCRPGKLCQEPMSPCKRRAQWGLSVGTKCSGWEEEDFWKSLSSQPVSSGLSERLKSKGESN